MFSGAVPTNTAGSGQQYQQQSKPFVPMAGQMGGQMGGSTGGFGMAAPPKQQSVSDVFGGAGFGGGMQGGMTGGMQGGMQGNNQFGGFAGQKAGGFQNPMQPSFSAGSQQPTSSNN